MCTDQRTRPPDEETPFSCANTVGPRKLEQDFSSLLVLDLNSSSISTRRPITVYVFRCVSDASCRTGQIITNQEFSKHNYLFLISTPSSGSCAEPWQQSIHVHLKYSNLKLCYSGPLHFHSANRALMYCFDTPGCGPQLVLRVK